MGPPHLYSLFAPKEITFNTALGPLRAARGSMRFVCGTEGREPTRTAAAASAVFLFLYMGSWGCGLLFRPCRTGPAEAWRLLKLCQDWCHSIGVHSPCLGFSVMRCASNAALALSQGSSGRSRGGRRRSQGGIWDGLRGRSYNLHSNGRRWCRDQSGGVAFEACRVWLLHISNERLGASGDHFLLAFCGSWICASCLLRCSDGFLF